jgi:hypothetical protein
MDENKQQKLKELIYQNLSLGKLNLTDAAILTKLLSYAEDDETLNRYILLLSKEFAFLNGIFEEEEAITKAKLEDLVHNFVLEIIKDNPNLAKEISEFASKPGVTQEDILNKYPEFKNYLKK